MSAQNVMPIHLADYNIIHGMSKRMVKKSMKGLNMSHPHPLDNMNVLLLLATTFRNYHRRSCASISPYPLHLQPSYQQSECPFSPLQIYNYSLKGYVNAKPLC